MKISNQLCACSHVSNTLSADLQERMKAASQQHAELETLTRSVGMALKRLSIDETGGALVDTLLYILTQKHVQGPQGYQAATGCVAEGED